MKKFFAVLLIVWAAAGCATTDATMRAFLGESSSDLVAILGRPDQQIPDGQGGEIWVYTEVQTATVEPERTQPGEMYGLSSANDPRNAYNGYSARYGRADNNFSHQISRTVSQKFYINAAHKIYRCVRE
ncbi:MAG TPA: hypothetical protein VHB20_15065 [Verrucomicrobiae bacterium]|jgi:hypothetical protein|nr:hypothetical protein [Verrucomicrobiae bacterium]